MTISLFGYIPYLGIIHLRLSPSISMWSNTVGLVFFSLLAPFFGALSDKIGRKPILLSVSLLYFISAFPFFLLLDHANVQLFFFIQLFFSLIASAYYGVTMATCIEHFPTHIRYTGVALGYYVTYALFGGINGLYIVKLLIKDKYIDVAPVFYLMLGACIVFLSSLFIKEESSKQLPNK